jgi:hypothetical protein
MWGWGGGGKEDTRKGMRISIVAARIHLQMQGAKLVQNIRIKKEVQDHLCMVTKADRSDEDWQQGQLAYPSRTSFLIKRIISLSLLLSVLFYHRRTSRHLE